VSELFERVGWDVEQRLELAPLPEFFGERSELSSRRQ
jgi:hypothetical protein